MSDIVTEQDYLDSLSEETKAQIRETLLDWKAAGNPHPQLDAMVDISGDGIMDFFELDEHDELIMVPGAEADQSDYDLTGVEIVEETEGLGEL